MLRGGLWERALAALARHTAVLGPADWLAPETACDWPLAHLPDDHLGPELDGLGLDHAVHRQGETRRKRVLIADMDSTIVQSETLDELAGEAGIKDQIAAITMRSMRGELDFAEALTERVGALKGLEEAALARTLARTRVMPGATRLVRTMRAQGAICWLVSGGFSYFTSHIAKQVGFHADRSNRLCIADGRLTGTVGQPILDRNAKLEALHALCGEAGVAPAEALAVGDGANDLAMIQAAGMGVAFQAKPAVKEAARFRVNRADLTTLLYFQGYRAAEITDRLP
ncbi:MAG: phosphoserine phosphatase SerB [Alphaproteobacteria bacterium]|nr:phosphoserine phosphatase SerB [Alphaproteobacteria bacterium]MCB9929657.1 phosphoserine phosphatase SerB [Alphaproteobacteria bacterium]